jgi:dihydroorotate dehydrogenase electron transfer subunit
MMRVERMTVVANRSIARNIFELTVTGELARRVQAPGQFVHIRPEAAGTLLRRPISICRVDGDQKRLTVVFRAEGSGTKALAACRVGDALDVFGPLGNGFPTDRLASGERALIVGGGVGVPPLYELSKRLAARGVAVMHVLGFRSACDVFYEDAFSALGPTWIATEDGSRGFKGRVTDVIAGEGLRYDAMFACGPRPMLQALAAVRGDKPLFLSLEERMGCALGACFACVVRVKDDETGTAYRKICTDGPVFEAGEVVF